jgi:uracil-DNA glycosylase
MSLEDLKERMRECDRCGQNRFWNFPSCKHVDGFFGNKEYVFVCSQPHEGKFDPYVNRFDRRFYDNLVKYGFRKAHLTDMVKCRGTKYKEITGQIDNCVGWLREEIQIVQPKAIVAVGNKSFDALIENRFRPVLQITHYSQVVNDEDYEKEFRVLRDCLDSGRFRHGTRIKDLIAQGQIAKPEEQDLFQDFKTLLDKLKGNGKISPEQWREYVGQWQRSPQDRDILMQQLKSMSAKDTD